MANVFQQELLVQGYAQALMHLRKRLPFLQYVLRKDDDIAVGGGPGHSVTIPIPSKMSDAEDVVAGAAPYVGEDVEANYATVKLNRWKRKAFSMTDAEMNSVAEGFLGAQNMACLDALAGTVVKDVLGGFYKKIYHTVGTVGTVPFASDFAEAAEARKKLNRVGVPPEMRYLMLDADAEANAIQLQAFNQLQNAGPEAMATLKYGEIGQKAGFLWSFNGYLEEACRHSNGTAAPGSYLVNGIQSVGSSVLLVKTGTGAPTEGTAFNIAGDTQDYVCGAGCTTTSWNISPPLRKSAPDNAIITIKGTASPTGSYFQSIAFHRDALAFASRPDNNMIAAQSQAQIVELPDPESGLVLTMEVIRQDARTQMQYRLRYGYTVCRPECAVRIFGASI